MMNREQALRALSALANGTRLDLVRLLMQAGDGGVAAGEIARALGISASGLSFHLSALESAGLIAQRRESRNVIYRADISGIGGTIAFLLGDCCLHHPEIAACCHPQQDAAADPAPVGASER